MHLPKMLILGDVFIFIQLSIIPTIYNTSLRSRHDIAKASFIQFTVTSKSTITALTDGRSITSFTVAV